jgi:hypothetical protein
MEVLDVHLPEGLGQCADRPKVGEIHARVRAPAGTDHLVPRAGGHGRRSIRPPAPIITTRMSQPSFRDR